MICRLVTLVIFYSNFKLVFAVHHICLRSEEVIREQFKENSKSKQYIVNCGASKYENSYQS